MGSGGHESRGVTPKIGTPSKRSETRGEGRPETREGRPETRGGTPQPAPRIVGWGSAEGRPVSQASQGYGGGAATSPEPARTAGGHRKHVPVMGGIFEQSPRTLNQTRKGAPEIFLGAQEVDLGAYSSRVQGAAIPRGWDLAPKQKTLTELVAMRRKAFIPDISFDLDGDGIVSREDWTASIKADRDKDGRLNTAERAHAEAIVKGKAPFDLFKELRPITAPTRFDPVGWPVYHKQEDDMLTRTLLLEERRHEMVEENHANHLRNEAIAQAHVPAWKMSSEFSQCRLQAAANLPPKKVRTVEMENEKQAVRLAVGLEATMTSLNPARLLLDPVSHPSGQVRYEDQREFTLMGYRTEAPFATKSQLLDYRRQSNLENLEESVQRVGPTFRNETQRLEARDNAYFLQAQLALQNPENKVRSNLMQTRREDSVKQLIDMWGPEQRPPTNAATRAKPSERTAFWALDESYRPDPAHNSSVRLRQSHKWFKKVPEYFLSEGPKVWGEGGPADPYNRKVFSKAAKESVLDAKIGGGGQPEDRGAYIPRPPAKEEIRVNVKTPDPNRLSVTMEAQDAQEARELSLPLYSSFTPENVYQPRPLARSRPHSSWDGPKRSNSRGKGEIVKQPIRMVDMIKNLPSKFNESTRTMDRAPSTGPPGGHRPGRQQASVEFGSGNGNGFRSLASANTMVRSSGILPKTDDTRRGLRY
mmetsp:Transcript_59448/g.140549  ORF Transcript_59448/g.140549 Transcript_59448/m.140549 type:complete len:702 (-) Transcript_59448:148-2253(-)